MYVEIVKPSEPVEVEAPNNCAIRLSNVALGASSESAQLFLNCAGQKTVIVRLNKEYFSAYSCNLTFRGKKTVILESQGGEIHVIGEFVKQEQESLTIAKEVKHKSPSANSETKVEPEPVIRRSMRPRVQRKCQTKSVGTLPKGKLAQMLADAGEDSDDDQSFKEGSEESSSSSDSSDQDKEEFYPQFPKPTRVPKFQ